MIFLVMTAAVGKRHRHVLGRGTQTLLAALDRLDGGIHVGNVAVNHRILRQGLDRIALDAPLALAGIGQLDHLH